ncbi:cytochrome P450 monooxygenase [Abortiporus biennis]|nr:cytochrome P450 monooxygenase [Abortiporus biennis]
MAHTLSPASVVVLTILVLVRFVYTRWFQNRICHRPPGPHPVPFFGNALQLPMEYQELTIWDWGKKYGNIIYARFFQRHAIMINSLEIAHDLLTKRSANYSDRPPFVSLDLMGWELSTVLLPYNTRYKRHRRWIREAFTNKKKLLGYRAIQQRETYILLSGLMSTPQDLSSHFLRYTAAVIVEIVFGHTITAMDDIHIRLAETATVATVEAGSPGSMLVDFFPILQYWPTWMPFSGWKRKALAIRNLAKAQINTPYNMVKDKMANGSARPCMVSDLIDELNQKDGGMNAEDDMDVKYATGILYEAATETTVTVLDVFVLAMVKYPRVFKKAQEELDRVVGLDRLPEYEDRESLPYLNCVLKELYRWHPPFPLGVPHSSTNQDEYKGYKIPSGSMVMPNMWGMTRNEDFYHDPEEFIPERFEQSLIAQLNPSAFAQNLDSVADANSTSTQTQFDYKDPSNIVFGFGRRQCLGQEFADIGIFFVMACMISTLDISRDIYEHGEEIDPPHSYKSGFVHHVYPFKFVMKPRSKKVVDMVSQLVCS